MSVRVEVDETCDGTFGCHTYGGGSVHMNLVFGEIEGSLVTDIGYVAE
ncbi:MAG TPA: hypothetical protein VGR26_12465 [Acidimicrobiales bacterium]|nr:hypothetical protein [Acidimicrobiales bacterium]